MLICDYWPFRVFFGTLELQRINPTTRRLLSFAPTCVIASLCSLLCRTAEAQISWAWGLDVTPISKQFPVIIRQSSLNWSGRVSSVVSKRSLSRPGSFKCTCRANLGLTAPLRARQGQAAYFPIPYNKLVRFLGRLPQVPPLPKSELTWHVRARTSDSHASPWA